ncbi:MAG: glycosyltransferase family 2 protein, partial [Bacteroidota bacterium]
MKSLISIIIVTRNEADYIEDCLASVISQLGEHHPRAEKQSKWKSEYDFELIIVDGMSTDGTMEIARNWCSANEVQAVLLENPKKTLAAGWNIGITNSKGEFLVRPDAHAKLHPGYILICMKALENFPEAGAAGGRLETKSKGRIGEVIAKVLSSRVGVGNSSFRTSQVAGFQDTVVYGLYRREVFEKAGLFNEFLTRHQDTEFHHRMKVKGYRFYFEPEAIADYYCRRDMSSLVKQYFNIGYYLPDLLKAGYRRAVRPRHMAPAGFYTACILLIVLG